MPDTLEEVPTLSGFKYLARKCETVSPTGNLADSSVAATGQARPKGQGLRLMRVGGRSGQMWDVSEQILPRPGS